MSNLSEKAANEVIQKLNERHGFDYWWEDIDASVREDIRETIAKTIATTYSRGDKTDD